MNKDGIIWRLILIQVFSIPVSSFLSVRILLLTILTTLVLSSLNKSPIEFIRKSWDSFVYLIVLCIGVVYSENVSVGLKVLETNFSFLAIPAIVSRIHLSNERERNSIFFSFIFGLIVACLICFINAILHYSGSGDLQVFFFNQLTDIIHSQPTYFAYYLIFAITFLLYLLYYEKSEWNPLLLVLTIAFFFLMLMLTGGRTTFISMLLIFSFFVLKFLVEAKSFASKLTFGIVVTMTICMFLVTATEQNARDLALNDSWDRLVLWESAMNATTDWVWGVGTGDYKEVLNQYYRTHNLSEFAADSYNAHNQFIQTFLTNGIPGLLAVLLLICRPLYLSVKNQDVLGTLVFFPFLIYGMTEVFLGRYQGIVFFALLHQVFISYYVASKPLSTALKGA